VVPINRDILKAASDITKQEGGGPDSKLVDKLFSEWSKYNAVRVSIAAVAWFLGMAALVLA